MNLRRQLLRTFVLQGAGSACILLATLILGAQMGPEVQGGFSRTKAEVEFVAALAMFGLPQSLFFHVKSGRMSDAAALRWTAISGLVAVAIGTALGLERAGAALALVLGLAVAACAVHGQLRVLVLVRERTEWFNVFTALPQLLVLLGVLAVAAGVVRDPQSPAIWWLVYAAAFALAATLAWAKLRASVGGADAATPANRVAVLRYGLATWIAAALPTAAVLFAQRWVEDVDGAAALGRFTLALTLVQVPLTPVAYAAPLLFRRWMERPGGRASRRWAARLSLLLFGGAIVVWLAAPLWPDLGLGAAYDGATRALGVLLAGGAAEAASRIMAAQATASGKPWIGVHAEVARWAVLGLAWLLPLPGDTLVVCAAWAVAAAAAALVFALRTRDAPAEVHA